MSIKTEYIEFTITDEAKFKDMKYVYDKIAYAKNSEQPMSDEYWLTIFPEYSLKHFYFLDSDVKPRFTTASKDEYNWRCTAIINLLQIDLDVELLDCKRLEKKGRIEFSAYGYPYGGITGLTIFLNAFDCKATEMDEGGGNYSVEWISKNNFKLNEINTPVKFVSSKPNHSWWQRIFGIE